MNRLGSLVLAATLCVGCLPRNTSAPPRFFAPDSSAIATEDDPLPSSGATIPIRLRAVEGTAFLRERIVWRVSSVEYGQYRDRLWNELPATYVQRALAAALRRIPELRLTDEAHAPALHVELLEFDEVLAPEHTATVTLAVSLRHPDRGRLLERTFSVRQPIADEDPTTMASAMGRAMDEATSAVAAAVAGALR